MTNEHEHADEQTHQRMIPQINWRCKGSVNDVRTINAARMDGSKIFRLR